MNEKGNFEAQSLWQIFEKLSHIINVLLLLILQRLFDTLIQFQWHEEVLINSVQNHNFFLEICIRCIICLKQFGEDTSSCVEEYDTCKHGNDAKDSLNIIRSRYVTISHC